MDVFWHYAEGKKAPAREGAGEGGDGSNGYGGGVNDDGGPLGAGDGVGFFTV